MLTGANNLLYHVRFLEQCALYEVDTGKNYVLDPASSELGEGSIEITGTDLDWRKDRIMIVNCQDT